MERVIAEAFGIDANDLKCPELKRADVQLLVDEKASLMVPEPAPWPEGAPSTKRPERIQAWSASQSKDEFLSRFFELTRS
ncbi:hypothetical protein QEZ52_17125 [Aliisedimentitalea scapharcae]|uniref:Uncharacterized protein n=1 Tax=Aliisedimentitalea scapharcae TaxID=1524259 RepID=A0ABZ2XTX1_9RHOB